MILNGGAGDDFLDGGAGIDILNGGSGEDTIKYDQAPAGIHVDLFIGQTLNDGWGSHDIFFDYVENVIGSNHDDTIIGAGVLPGMSEGQDNE